MEKKLQTLPDGRLVEMLNLNFPRKIRRMIIKGWYWTEQVMVEGHLSVVMTCKPAKSPEVKSKFQSYYSVGDTIEGGTISGITLDNVRSMEHKSVPFFVFVYELKKEEGDE